MEAISILNQAATIAQFLHAPTWHVEAMNFPRYGYTGRIIHAWKFSRFGFKTVKIETSHHWCIRSRFQTVDFSVHLNPELQITHVATSVLEPSPQQQVSPNSVSGDTVTHPISDVHFAKIFQN